MLYLRKTAKLSAHKTLPDVESKRAEKTKCFLSFLPATVIVRATRNNCRNEIFRGKCDLAEFQILFAYLGLFFVLFSCFGGFFWLVGFLTLAGTCAYGQLSWRVCWACHDVSNLKIQALPVTHPLLQQQSVPLRRTPWPRANNSSAPAFAACLLSTTIPPTRAPSNRHVIAEYLAEGQK